MTACRPRRAQEIDLISFRGRACDRGNSPQDVRHTFTSNWIYPLPFGAGQRFLNSGLASKILGGWETSGIWALRTGRMLTVTISRSANDLPDGNSRNPRPNVVPGVSIYPAGGPTYAQWFNPLAFVIPASRGVTPAVRSLPVPPGPGGLLASEEDAPLRA